MFIRPDVWFIKPFDLKLFISLKNKNDILHQIFIVVNINLYEKIKYTKLI